MVGISRVILLAPMAFLTVSAPLSIGVAKPSLGTTSVLSLIISDLYMFLALDLRSTSYRVIGSIAYNLSGAPIRFICRILSILEFMEKLRFAPTSDFDLFDLDRKHFESLLTLDFGFFELRTSWTSSSGFRT